MTLSTVFWTADSLAIKHDLIIHHHKSERLVKRKKSDYCIQNQGHSEGSKFQCLSRWYLLNRQAFLTKRGIVMHHYELECRAKRIVGYFQCEGYSKGSFDQNMTISTIFSKLLIVLLSPPVSLSPSPSLSLSLTLPLSLSLSLSLSVFVLLEWRDVIIQEINNSSFSL